MFQGIIFVVLAAFVAFGATLFMATPEMNARVRPDVVAPSERAKAAGQQTAESEAKAKKSRGTNRSGRGPTSGKKSASPSSTMPVVAPLPNAPLSNGAASLRDS